ncbi:lytic transglycosylase domain-containing protein [Ahrensia marina]|uniref:lytic transglycosylase domain-containing protein n=1 Tax=Ahrensia marina TaxID=1514904 RepID=UPI000A9CE1D3|nr:lytic transglycosylase domain-containing protein [Ahrensia marina]
MSISWGSAMQRLGSSLCLGLHAAALNCAGATMAIATVIEFGSDGQLTITEAKPAAPKSVPGALSNDDKDKSALKQLTRDIALTFSGATGVHKARLDVLTFVEIFEALINAESSFNPKALSPKGAQGLGQLMPETAADLKVENPFDPKQNLIGSARYFTQLLERFGSLDLALAAYNAGPQRVEQYGGIPPFPETRSYIAGNLKVVGLPDFPVAASSEVATTKPALKQDRKEQHLEGDVSVWEF